MTGNTLEREARVYGAYLTGSEPTAYVTGKYLEYHSLVGIPVTGFDGVLVGLSRWGAGWTLVADSYACRFCKGSALRKKLVLMLALLECAPPASDYLDGVDGGGLLGVLAKLIWRTLVHILATLASFVLLPVHLLGFRRGQP